MMNNNEKIAYHALRQGSCTKILSLVKSRNCVFYYSKIYLYTWTSLTRARVMSVLAVGCPCIVCLWTSDPSPQIYILDNTPYRSLYNRSYYSESFCVFHTYLQSWHRLLAYYSLNLICVLFSFVQLAQATARARDCIVCVGIFY